MISFKNVSKSFGTRAVLKNVSFEIQKGQIVFILGKSGVGKSVTLKTLVGLLRPDAGEVWFDRERVDTYSEEQWGSIRKRCGMVFQHPALLDSLTVYENIVFGLRHLPESEKRARAESCLQLVHLRKEILSYAVQDISYGMQKRVSLARTLAVQPEVLLFDEPTTGLDPITTNAINELILELSRKLHVTSVVVSHDMGCALKIADHLIVLDEGSIIEQGNLAAIRNSSQTLVQSFLEETLAL